MFKLIGFIAGAALVALPAWWLPEFPQTWDRPAPQTALERETEPPPEVSTEGGNGIPDGTASTPEPDHRPSPVPLGMAVTAGVAVAGRPDTTGANSDEQAVIAPVETGRVQDPDHGETPAVTPVETGTAPDPDEGETAAAEPEPPTSRESRVQLIWSPFRSEAAARGFARRLSNVSGVDVRIAEAGRERYRVGFSYRDEIERNWALGQIAARTGLVLATPTTDDGTQSHETDGTPPAADAPGVAADGGGAD